MRQKKFRGKDENITGMLYSIQDPNSDLDSEWLVDPRTWHVHSIVRFIAPSCQRQLHWPVSPDSKQPLGIYNARPDWNQKDKQRFIFTRGAHLTRDSRFTALQSILN